MSQIKVGSMYRHYKGNKYEVIAIGKHSENLEDMVVYRDLTNEKVWIRPLNMFAETIIVDGNEIDRFQEI